MLSDESSRLIKPWSGLAVVTRIVTGSIPRGPGVPHTVWRHSCVRQTRRNCFKASAEVPIRRVLGVEELECHVAHLSLLEVTPPMEGCTGEVAS